VTWSLGRGHLANPRTKPGRRPEDTSQRQAGTKLGRLRHGITGHYRAVTCRADSGAGSSRSASLTRGKGASACKVECQMRMKTPVVMRCRECASRFAVWKTMCSECGYVRPNYLKRVALWLVLTVVAVYVTANVAIQIGGGRE
jgi:ribosomal protein L37E